MKKQQLNLLSHSNSPDGDTVISLPFCCDSLAPCVAVLDLDSILARDVYIYISR